MCIKLHSFKERLKELRNEKEYTQKTFAKAFGVSYDTVKNWEQCRSIPEIHDLLRLCDFFDCDLDYLIGRIDCKKHDFQFIHDTIGLDEKAIILLRDFYNSNNENMIELVNLLSEVILYDNGHTYPFISLLDDIRTYCISHKTIFEGNCFSEDQNYFDKRDLALFNASRQIANITEGISKAYVKDTKLFKQGVHSLKRPKNIMGKLMIKK